MRCCRQQTFNPALGINLPGPMTGLGQEFDFSSGLPPEFDPATPSGGTRAAWIAAQDNEMTEVQLALLNREGFLNMSLGPERGAAIREGLIQQAIAEEAKTPWVKYLLYGAAGIGVLYVGYKLLK